jgi:hypothetical protein
MNKPANMIRIAVFGTKEKSEDIIRLINKNDDCILSGLYTKVYESDISPISSVHADTLTDNSDALIFTDQIFSDFDCIKKALKKSKHVFLFPDAKLSFYQLDELNKLADEAGVILYLKHNLKPELKRLLQGHYGSPEYISIFRYHNRKNIHAGKTILDSLYKEIIFILAVNKHSTRKFSTSTVPYCSPDP